MAPLLLLWTGADLCGAMMGGRYYPHYFLPALLSLSIVSCISLDALATVLSGIRYRVIASGMILLPIGFLALQGEMNFYHSAEGNPPDDGVQAGIFIRNHMSPSDTVFTWQFRPGIYRVAGGHTPTRWASAHYLYDFPGAYQSVGAELMTELRAAPPTFIVYPCGANYAPALEAGGSATGATRSPATDPVRAQFTQFLADDYHPVYRAGATCVSQR